MSDTLVKECAEGEKDDNPRSQRRDSHAQQQHNGCNGKDREQRFLDFLYELWIDLHGLAPFGRRPPTAVIYKKYNRHGGLKYRRNSDS